jgi:hypothetical protein
VDGLGWMVSVDGLLDVCSPAAASGVVLSCLGFPLFFFFFLLLN